MPTTQWSDGAGGFPTSTTDGGAAVRARVAAKLLKADVPDPAKLVAVLW